MAAETENLWCFLHLSSGRAVVGISDTEARAIVMAVGAEDSSWLVWRHPWPEWKSLELVQELHEPFNRILQQQPPALPGSDVDDDNSVSGRSLSISAGPQGMMATTGKSKIKSESDAILQLENMNFEADESGAFIVRKSRRFNKRYEITVMLNGQVFNTHSVDISVGGVKIEQELPEWVAGYFKIRIKKPGVKQIIELSACLLEGEAAPDRFRISILPLQSPKDETNLELWLAA